MAWDPTVPADNEAASQGASRIRSMKGDVAQALTVEGSFPVDPANPQFYPKLKKGNTAARPAASANYPGRQYVNTDLGDGSGTGVIQRVKDDGSGWENVFKDPASAAIHAAVGAALASVAGVVTLPETGNSFNVTGAEQVTQIAGWSAGRVIIQWQANRIIVNGAGLVLKNGLSRNVIAGDISIFEFTGANSVREIGFYGAGMGAEVGQTIMHNGSTPPPGFLEENGASLLRTDYPALFAVIGTSHGAADGTHFNLPDSRGRFARGWDHGAGNDPNAAARTAVNPGGATGDNVGSLQGEQSGDTITTSTPPGAVGFSSGSNSFSSQGILNSAVLNHPNESRPKNVNKMFCIKF